MAVPAGVDEAGGRVDQQPEPAERALALEPRDEVVRQRDALERRAEHELAGVQDERLVAVDLDELGQLLLLLLDVDVRVARVAEDAEEAVDAHVEARRLHQRRVVRVDADPALVEQSPDRAVGEDHAPILRGDNSPRSGCANAVRSVPRCRCSTHPSTRTSASAIVGTRCAGRSASGAAAVWRSAARRDRASGWARGSSATATTAVRSATTASRAEPLPPRPRRPRAAPGRDPRRPRDRWRLASLPGKLEEYVGYKRDGLTTIELDVKDENGEIGFVPVRRAARDARSAPRARTTTARGASRGSRTGTAIYLIGRVVVFEDPVLSRARPDLAIRRVRRLRLATTRRARLDEPVRPARLELQRRRRGRRGEGRLRRDHVRLRALPVRRRRRRAPSTRARRAARAREADRRLPRATRSSGSSRSASRVSAAVFGLSATRDLGIGQLPR